MENNPKQKHPDSNMLFKPPCIPEKGSTQICQPEERGLAPQSQAPCSPQPRGTIDCRTWESQPKGTQLLNY